VDKDKLKEEQKAELKKALEAYEQECLKSFSMTRAGEVIKKFDFPTLQPLTEVQRENRILDMVHQAAGHAFVSHAPVMTNTVHNAVIKTLNEGGFRATRASLSVVWPDELYSCWISYNNTSYGFLESTRGEHWVYTADRFNDATSV